ncbi:hypothetical protein [Brevundimonas naejangsanensis]|uniref:hypothetical protein n=1 Tax=Brevundimonas naejangsanensis TaxID=588932 RepID=UPI0034D53BE3
MANLLGQRWLYRIGNSIVCIDNAFAWTGWGQERMRVNDEVVQESRGWLKPSQTFAEPWLTRIGDDQLSILLVSGVMSVHCMAELGGALLEPEERLAARWSGSRGSWPEESDWRPARRGDFIALPKGGGAKG